MLPDLIERDIFQPSIERYRWVANVRQVAGEPELYDATVAVSWPDGAFALSTRLYRRQSLARR